MIWCINWQKSEPKARFTKRSKGWGVDVFSLEQQKKWWCSTAPRSCGMRQQHWAWLTTWRSDPLPTRVDDDLALAKDFVGEVRERKRGEALVAEPPRRNWWGQERETGWGWRERETTNQRSSQNFATLLYVECYVYRVKYRMFHAHACIH